MYENAGALIPVALAGWFFFGWPALKILALSAGTALLVEWGWEKLFGPPANIRDGSALLTGLLLGCILTTEVPWWIPILGSLVAITVGRHAFGGMGNHPFSSVLVGWAFLEISYKEILETYPLAEPRFWLEASEFFSDPPLIAMKDDLESILEVPWSELFFGNVPGTLGTVCVLAILLGGAYLLYRRIITWHIPLSFIFSAWLFALIMWQVDPEVYAPPTFHILSGWMMFGAFFLATEKGTAPVTPLGMIFYGIGCGVLTIIIRTWGIYTEGVPFAILLMNGATPLLDRIKPGTAGRSR